MCYYTAKKYAEYFTYIVENYRLLTKRSKMSYVKLTNDRKNKTKS